MSRRPSKSLVIASVLLPLLAAPALAFTFTLDPKTMGRIDHIIECVGWKLENPPDPRYAKFCLPSHVTKVQIDELTNFAGTIAQTSPTTSSSYSSYSYPGPS